MSLAVLAFAVVAQAPQWDYRSDQWNLAMVMDHVRRTAPKAHHQVEFIDRIPATAKYKLAIRTREFESLMYGLAVQTPMRFVTRSMPCAEKDCAVPKTKWFVSWSEGAVGKGRLRLYKEAGSFVLAVNDTKLSDVATALQAVSGYDPTSHFKAADFSLDWVIPAFKTEGVASLEEETPERFTLRLIKELRALAAKSGSRAAFGMPPAPAPAARASLYDPSARTRTVWNLTFLPGEPPQPHNVASKVVFKDVNSTADTLAKALNAAFKGTGSTAEASAPDFTASAVNTSLILEGKQGVVDEVRRLLATQLDVPQSQILLELDAYQVSANVKSREAAERSVRRLMLAQEVARIYKLAHMQAVKQTIMKQPEAIRKAIDERSAFYGLDVSRLLADVGIDPNPVRLLGQSDLLAFLSYCPTDGLNREYPASLEEQFADANDRVKKQLVDPLGDSESPDDKKLAQEMSALNDAFLARATPAARRRDRNAPTPSWALLRTFAQGSDEDEITRHALEEFLMLWLATADREIADGVNALEATPKASSDLTSDPVYDYLRKKYPFGDPGRSVGMAVQTKVRDAIRGDRPSKLARSSARLDDLIRVGMEALQEDSRYLVDAPLQAWIDRQVLRQSQNSGFAVRFGGTTKLAVTSRVPGVTGAESETFFPYQPTAPISLDSLIPLLSRQTPPAATTGTEGALAVAGMTPLETLILQGAFAQAAQPPFYRKLATGLHVSVVPTMLSNGSAARLQVRLNLGVTPDDLNKGGAGEAGKPGPVDLIKTNVVETEILANTFDIATLSSLKLDVSAPGKRDWEFPILSQILPIRSWFVGPTQDKTVRHEAVVLVKVMIVPRAMDLASRFLNSQPPIRN